MAESPSSTVSCFPTADADEKQSIRDWVNPDWYFHGDILLVLAIGALSNRACFVCLLDFVSQHDTYMWVILHQPPPTPQKKMEGSQVKDEIESEGHWVCGPYLHGRCQCSRHCVHCYMLNACGVGLLKKHVHVRSMILQPWSSSAHAPKKYATENFNKLVVFFL